MTPFQHIKDYHERMKAIAASYAVWAALYDMAAKVKVKA